MYQWSSTIGILAGLRRDHLSFELSQNNSLNILGGGITAEQDYLGDFLEKLWVPYLGLQMNGPNYRARLIWSPFVSVSLNAPLGALGFQLAGGLPFIQNVQDFRFTVFNPGALFEANFEYSQQFGRWLSLGLWGNAGWFKLSDNGQLAAQVNTLLLGSFFRLSDSASATATLTRNTLAGGIFAEVKF